MAIYRLQIYKQLNVPRTEYLDTVTVLANPTEVILIWVPGHCGIPGNEKADELARQCAAMTLLGPQPARVIPRCSARVANQELGRDSTLYYPEKFTRPQTW